MSTATAPPPPQKLNRIGLEASDYRGLKTTLCAGCGHNSISERIVECFYEMGVDPTQVIKLSGIGCSSKSPAYFLNLSHGFNAVHGRMPSVATGALLANHGLLALGVTGDGDTASIGIGQFVHLMRRNLPIIYLIEDNGCYGLTKGQFSATADLGSKLKSGTPNDLPPMIPAPWRSSWAPRSWPARFPATRSSCNRSLRPRSAHNGTSMIDVISPCVTFNDHKGSTKSYAYVREHRNELNEVDFVPFFNEIHIEEEFEPGTTREVKLHDGSTLVLKKLEDAYNPSDDILAIRTLHEHAKRGEVLTGVFYANTEKKNFLELLNMVDEPLATLPDSRVCPPETALQEVMQELR